MRRVVITGMGAVTPIGNNVSDMWNSMISSRHGIGRITHFDTDGFENVLAAEVKSYDASEYMSKKDAGRYDAYTLFGIGAASQAAESSGIAGKIDPERIGVYFSSGIGGLTTLEKGERALLNMGANKVSPFAVPAMIANSAAALTAIKYNCLGSCLSISTACASSAHAIGEAYRAVKDGYLDAVIAGGADAAINPIGVASFNACRALTKSTDPDRASIPFDAERSGFVIGEGGGALVLEEYEHAKKRGAEIHAEICGYGSTCDAFHITRPSPDADGAARAIKQAADESGINTGYIYINAHGTSTKLNDELETLAIKKGLGEELAYKAVISSTKSMTGHLLGGAGAVGAIAAVMALRTGIIPPTAGFRIKDEACDLDICPNTARKARIELALSNSFGFGGHNSCLAFK
ncbi:MAG: beta-ketoacyl-ACP synthase II, partial [Candidatus Ornithomonoglobus sp.]